MNDDASSDEYFGLDMPERVDFAEVRFTMPKQFLQSNYPATRIGILKAYGGFHRDDNAIQLKFKERYDSLAEMPYSEGSRTELGEPLMEGYHLMLRIWDLEKKQWDPFGVYRTRGTRKFLEARGLTPDELDECSRIQFTVMRSHRARINAYQRHKYGLGKAIVDGTVSLASADSAPLSTLSRVHGLLGGEWGAFGPLADSRSEKQRQLYLEETTSEAAGLMEHVQVSEPDRPTLDLSFFPNARADDLVGNPAVLYLRKLSLIEEDLQTLKPHIDAAVVGGMTFGFGPAGESTAFDALWLCLLNTKAVCQQNNPVEMSLKNACDLTNESLEKIPSATQPHTTVEQLDDDIEIVNGLSRKFETNLRDLKKRVSISPDPLPKVGEPNERPSDSSLFTTLQISDETRQSVLETRRNLYQRENEQRALAAAFRKTRGRKA